MRRALAIGALVLAALTLGLPRAVAHAQLESSTPADGSVLAVAPSTVSFTFNEDLLAGSTTIAVVDASGAVVATDPGTITGPTISAALPPLAPGGYQVSYRVVSADGHPITGAIGMTVDAAAAPAPTGSPRASATGTPQTSDATSAATTEATTSATAPATLLVGLGAVAVVILVFAILRRRGSRGEDGRDS